MRLHLFLLGLFLLFGVNVAHAEIGGITQTQKNLTLYAEPKADANVIANLKQGQQVIAIFQQGEWIKLANPANGEVGWVKKSDFTPSTTQATSFQGYVIKSERNKDGTVTTRAYQLTDADMKPLPPEQAQAIEKQLMAQRQQMLQQQQLMQNQFDRMMRDSFKQFEITQKMLNDNLYWSNDASQSWWDKVKEKFQ